MIAVGRELIVAIVVASVVMFGFAVEYLGDPVESESTAAPPQPHVERATFCPPVVQEDEVESVVAVAASSGQEMPLGFEQAQSEGETLASPPALEDLAAGSFGTKAAEGGTALNAVGFGEHPVAGASNTFVSPVVGAGAARCSESASTTWYLPVGSSELGFDERILLYNPFPDEAVARISFFTPVGERSRGSLADVAVPSGGFEEVRVNEFISTQKVLSASVEVARGRLVAWRVLFARPEEGTRGVSLALGAAQPSPLWYFPDGFVGEGTSETFTILNPGDDEATVNISLIAEDKRIRIPEDLFEVPVEPRTSQSVSLSDVGLAGGSGAARVSAVVAASNGVDIVVERALRVETTSYEGLATEVGLPQTSTRWALPPAVLSSTRDSIAVLNPSNEAAQIDVTLFTQEGASTPRALTDIKVAPGLRSQINLQPWSREAPVFAMLEASGPVVAERLAYSSSSSDIADAMGRALTPSAP